MSAKQLVVVLIVFLVSSTSVSGQSARALLIAIDKYPENSGWRDIHATNDIKLIEPVLCQRGFSKKNTTTIINEQATKAAIVEALQHLATNSHTGDHLYIQFSGHGQQMADDNGDETDGLDEALVTYDAQRRYVKGIYQGENHLRDDELGVLLDAIRLRVGSAGSVVLTLDACHSGTGDRDSHDTYVRGTTYIFAPSDFVRPEWAYKSSVWQIVAHPKMGDLTVIAACQPDELNYEYRCTTSGNYYGSLTYALCRIWQAGIPTSVEELRMVLSQQMVQLRPRRGKIQTPLLQTSDEKRVFRIGL